MRRDRVSELRITPREMEEKAEKVSHTTISHQPRPSWSVFIPVLCLVRFLLTLHPSTPPVRQFHTADLPDYSWPRFVAYFHEQPRLSVSLYLSLYSTLPLLINGFHHDFIQGNLSRTQKACPLSMSSVDHLFLRVFTERDLGSHLWILGILRSDQCQDGQQILQGLLKSVFDSRRTLHCSFGRTSWEEVQGRQPGSASSSSG